MGRRLRGRISSQKGEEKATRFVLDLTLFALLSLTHSLTPFWHNSELESLTFVHSERKVVYQYAPQIAFDDDFADDAVPIRSECPPSPSAVHLTSCCVKQHIKRPSRTRGERGDTYTCMVYARVKSSLLAERRTSPHGVFEALPDRYLPEEARG